MKLLNYSGLLGIFISTMIGCGSEENSTETETDKTSKTQEEEKDQTEENSSMELVLACFDPQHSRCVEYISEYQGLEINCDENIAEEVSSCDESPHDYDWVCEYESNGLGVHDYFGAADYLKEGVEEQCDSAGGVFRELEEPLQP